MHRARSRRCTSRLPPPGSPAKKPRASPAPSAAPGASGQRFPAPRGRLRRSTTHARRKARTCVVGASRMRLLSAARRRATTIRRTGRGTDAAVHGPDATMHVDLTRVSPCARVCPEPRRARGGERARARACVRTAPAPPRARTYRLRASPSSRRAERVREGQGVTRRPRRAAGREPPRARAAPRGDGRARLFLASARASGAKSAGRGRWTRWTWRWTTRSRSRSTRSRRARDERLRASEERAGAGGDESRGDERRFETRLQKKKKKTSSRARARPPRGRLGDQVRLRSRRSWRWAPGI